MNSKLMIFLLGIFTVFNSVAEDRFTPKDIWVFGGFQLGHSSLTTNVAGEAGDKTGVQYGMVLSTIFSYEKISINTATSYYFLNFESDRVGDVKYDLQTKTLAVEVSPLYKIYSGFSIGPKLQLVLTEKMLVGSDDVDNSSNDDVTTNMVLGVNAFFLHSVKYSDKEFDLRYGAHIHKPYNIGDRDAYIFLLSLELGQLINL